MTTATLLALRAPATDDDINRDCLVADYERVFVLLGERVQELARFLSLHRLEFAVQAGMDQRKARLYVADAAMWTATIDSILLGQHTASDYERGSRR